METVTIPKVQYQKLKNEASLYEKLFKFLPERVFGVENYSSVRIRDFLSEDKVDKKTKQAIEKLISA
jgi:hypothetical protein